MPIPPEPLATRRELDQLRRDLTRLDAEMDNRFRDHTQAHDRADQDRRTGQRWLIGTVIAALVCLVAILALLVQIHGQIR